MKIPPSVSGQDPEISQKAGWSQKNTALFGTQVWGATVITH